MTQNEILKFAMIGISALLDKEEEHKRVLQLTKCSTEITDRRLEKLTKQFSDVMELMREEENK